jgi:uncharacterized protein (TIGR02452 family)
MKAKIKTLLSVALESGHDALVLSALGCGAFACPPRHIAALFKEAIEVQRNGTLAKS